jgi:hypothetical protein
MADDTQDLLRLAEAHRRLLDQLTRRWVKGTGFVHGSVVRDLIAAGLVEHRIHRGERQIRAHSTKESDNG